MRGKDHQVWLFKIIFLSFLLFLVLPSSFCHPDCLWPPYRALTMTVKVRSSCFHLMSTVTPRVGCVGQAFYQLSSTPAPSSFEAELHCIAQVVLAFKNLLSSGLSVS